MEHYIEGTTYYSVVPFKSSPDAPFSAGFSPTSGMMLEQPGLRVQLQLTVERMSHAPGLGCFNIFHVDLNAI